MRARLPILKRNWRDPARLLKNSPSAESCISLIFGRNDHRERYWSMLLAMPSISIYVDLSQVHLTAAQQPSARIYLPHLGLARHIPVG
ncbi:MAG TPA: hypothetical protein VHT02_10730, partial [Methylocella sp.]|nr:hypothetical protein [Methylocella sp.]